MFVSFLNIFLKNYCSVSVSLPNLKFPGYLQRSLFAVITCGEEQNPLPLGSVMIKNSTPRSVIFPSAGTEVALNICFSKNPILTLFLLQTLQLFFVFKPKTFLEALILLLTALFFRLCCCHRLSIILEHFCHGVILVTQFFPLKIKYLLD